MTSHLTAEQIAGLETAFQRSLYLDLPRRIQLATQLNISSEMVVKVYFQNGRQRLLGQDLRAIYSEQQNKKIGVLTLRELSRLAVKRSFRLRAMVQDEETGQLCCRSCIEALPLPQSMIKREFLAGTRPVVQEEREPQTTSDQRQLLSLPMETNNNSVTLKLGTPLVFRDEI